LKSTYQRVPIQSEMLPGYAVQFGQQFRCVNLRPCVELALAFHELHDKHVRRRKEYAGDRKSGILHKITEHKRFDVEFRRVSRIRLYDSAGAILELKERDIPHASAAKRSRIPNPPRQCVLDTLSLNAVHATLDARFGYVRAIHALR